MHGQSGSNYAVSFFAVHNLCFEQKYKKYQIFVSVKIFIFFLW